MNVYGPHRPEDVPEGIPEGLAKQRERINTLAREALLEES